MEKGKLKQNGVHLEEHEYNTVKYLLESGYDVELIPPSKIKTSSDAGYHFAGCTLGNEVSGRSRKVYDQEYCAERIAPVSKYHYRPAALQNDGRRSNQENPALF